YSRIMFDDNVDVQSATMCYKIYQLILVNVGWANILPIAKSEPFINYDKTSSGCETPFESVNNGCYYFSAVQMDFFEATAYCESLAHESIYEITLAMMDYDRDEDQALLDVVTVKDKAFWVGGKSDDGILWNWIDSRDINLQAPLWDPREPNEVDNKCMIVQPDSFEEIRFNRSYLYDHMCSNTLDFICKIGNIKCPADFIRIGNYCYLQSWTIGLPDLTWIEAREYCQSLDVLDGYYADLSMLGLQDQDDYNLINILVDNYFGFPWIGAFREEGCSYKWIDDRELSLESSYWFYNQPTCGSDDHVGLYHNSFNDRTSLNDVTGNTSLSFICQMYSNL
ncbi:unnamed protein product, partial [Meganyctiphanes norvegica]